MFRRCAPTLTLTLACATTLRSAPMGIHGLLPFLKPYVKKVNVEDFKGKPVGVDAMCWMHKGAFACSRELVEGADTDKFVRFFLRMCEVLRCSQIKPIIVFDGDRLPAKAKEEENRGKNREKSRLEALELLDRQRSGHEVDEKEISSKCEGAIKVTPSMISRLQSALKELSIDFMIAPYEADAQLAYMCRMGWIDVAISEDSDLLAYGCPSILFKMDKYGNGDHIALPCLQVDASPPPPEQKQLNKENTPPDQKQPKGGKQKWLKPGHKAKKAPKGRKTTDQGHDALPVADAAENESDVVGQPSKVRRGAKAKSESDKLAITKDIQSCLDRWSPEQFAEFCVFCGTDYKEPDTHIKKFGIKTAFQFIRRYGSTQELLKWMISDKAFQQRLPCEAEEYIPRFSSVVCVFWHHLVFNLRSGECTSIATSFPLTESRRRCLNLDPTSVCGQAFSKQEAIRVAKGDLDPRTRAVKKLEPLTPAERAAIDSLLEFKRREQQEYRQQCAEEQAELRRAEAEAAALQAAARAQEEEPTSCVDDAASQEARAEPRKEIRLLAGDFKKIQHFVESLSDDVEDNSQSALEPALAEETEGMPRSSNPFSRKRPVQSTNSSLGKAIPASKGLRLRPVCSVAPTKAAVAVATQEEAIKLKKPEYRPRGGGGANAAVEAVLAQKGMPSLTTDDRKDRSKLGFFFGQGSKAAAATAQEAVQSDAPAGKVDLLSSWKSRPWETEPEELSNVPRVNVLSMRNRRLMACFATGR
ncbi:exo1 [Symbiodinium sp. CCMP2592]|nr:exo1 [Symbiodinium sp. CCMP2592]